MDLNKITLIGNLANDPETKTLTSGQTVSLFPLATNHSWNDAKTKEKKDRVDYHRIVSWGGLADIVNTYLKKGSKVYIEGRLQNRSWKDKDNQKKYTTEIIASDLIMLGGKNKKEVIGNETAKDDIDIEEIEQ